MFQKTVSFQYASGLPGEIAEDGPLRASPFRLVANATNAAAPIGFGLAFTYVPGTGVEVSNPGNLAAVRLARPGGGAVATASENVFAGILIHPKEHALYGSTAGPLEPVYSLPADSWGELCRVGILWANVSSPNTAGMGAPGDSLAYNPVNGQLTAFNGTAVPANLIQIPGARLLSYIGQNAAQLLAKIELTTVAYAPVAP